jgi:hypothetical protein
MNEQQFLFALPFRLNSVAGKIRLRVLAMA